MPRLYKAVLPVAGLGTRFLPATKAMPKELLPVLDRPLIQHAIDEARAAGFTHFCFVSARGKSALEDHFDRAPELEAALVAKGKAELLAAVQATTLTNLTVVRQPQALGLGHAVWCARDFVGDDPFAVLLPDDLMLAKLGNPSPLQQMVTAWERVGGALMAAQDVPRAETSKYGVLDIAADDGRLAQVRGMVEKPAPAAAPSTLTVVGRYILPARIMPLLGQLAAGTGGEIQLTDGIAALIGHEPVHGLRFEGQRFDCGNPLGFVEANLALALRDPALAGPLQQFMRAYLAGSSI